MSWIQPFSWILRWRTKKSLKAVDIRFEDDINLRLIKTNDRHTKYHEKSLFSKYKICYWMTKRSYIVNSFTLPYMDFPQRPFWYPSNFFNRGYCTCPVKWQFRQTCKTFFLRTNIKYLSFPITTFTIYFPSYVMTANNDRAIYYITRLHSKFQYVL